MVNMITKEDDSHESSDIEVSDKRDNDFALVAIINQVDSGMHEDSSPFGEAVLTRWHDTRRQHGARQNEGKRGSR